MYPFKRESHTFPLNAWYVAAWSHEVTATAPLGRTICNQPIVMFRGRDGNAAALDGRCAHRRFPLAAGCVKDGRVHCAYHGWAFETDGACAEIPSQEHVPAAFRNRAYPLVERWQWIWIWPGAPELADVALLPNHDELHVEDPTWVSVVGGIVPLQARFQLLNENVLDLTHISYTHATTIGTGACVTAPVRTEMREWCYRNVRETLNDQITPFHAAAMGYGGRIDREMITDFYPPALLLAGSRFSIAGTPGQPGRVLGEFRAIHAPTPETATTTHYFWGLTRDFAIHDPETTGHMVRGIAAVLEEDRTALEMQERMLALGDERPDLSAASDVAALRGRHMLERMMDAESEPRLARALPFFELANAPVRA